MPMILEGIVTTVNADGSVNIAPMGPIVEENMDRLCLRPFNTSTTYQNLQRNGRGVFHVTDDVDLLARAAVGQLATQPAMHRPDGMDGWILEDACRWYAFQVRAIDDREERVLIDAEVTARGVQREFFGFNRAKHAVLEAAILATRVGILPAAEIQAELARLATPVAKTGGPQEHAALEFLERYIAGALAKSPPSGQA